MNVPIFTDAAMDVILAELLGQISAAPRIPGIIGGTWLDGWRAASALVAPKLWDRFVWPYYLKLVEALIDVGITPVLHWDQSWTRDLVRLQELPARKCILNPDGMTDMRKFKQLVGDRMAMMGDVPASLLAAGTPDDISAYVHNLIDLFEGTGLILCPGCDAPINAKPENMEAFVAASHAFPIDQIIVQIENNSVSYLFHVFSTFSNTAQDFPTFSHITYSKIY